MSNSKNRERNRQTIIINEERATYCNRTAKYLVYQKVRLGFSSKRTFWPTQYHGVTEMFYLSEEMGDEIFTWR